MKVRGFGGDAAEGADGDVAQGPEALAFRDVSVRYRAGGAEVLRGVTLRVAAGERVALMGLNGSGKTTLLSAAAGLVPFTGRVAVCGIALEAGGVRQVRDRIGFLFGTPDDQILFPNVLEDVAFSLECRGVCRSEARERAREVLGRLGIGGLAACAPHGLSQGQRQRVALAGALVAEPGLLLLDEPSAALDAVGREELAAVLGGQRAALVMATHDLAFARRVCRRFVVLEAGRVVEDTADAGRVEEYETSRAEAARRRSRGV